MIKYKYNEDVTITELRKYVDETYSQHYSHGKYQATEFIIDAGFGEGFCLGNIMKYAQRYGKKEGKNKKDLFKIIHYAMMAIDTLAKDQQEGDNSSSTTPHRTYFINPDGV
ncbi:SaV-like [uncultured Caudovirales phage]|jgi:hypothetical protein|uniref:SaV-like n=1 Tax=uncultured Caudovirales phage TaxID=2100421 RepID=A0A6J5PK28_9CAUD|nr:SaV-like [uncultured Caudovirales phage]CAB4168550.1 SaV-like [uncultured Caudovirales phage]CAB4196414.1 SaV-like [uncultured Caudovirales phage]CAB4205015.1 SaV-like [uncultured Caudovirales phage]